MKVIGITGYAGSGKSTIAKILRDLGFVVLDLDKIGHEILKYDSVKDKLKEKFGEFICSENGTIDRKKIGEIVFKDKKKLKELNSIVHPLIKEYVINKIKNLKTDIVFIDGALIEEIGLSKICDYIILIDSSEEKRKERLIKYRNMSEEKVKDIINAQRNIKYNYTFKINNNNGIETIKKELLGILGNI